MTLIKSISGIRGTIGGKVGCSLTPIDLAAVLRPHLEDGFKNDLIINHQL